MNQPEQHNILTPLMMGAVAREIDRLSAKGPDEVSHQSTTDSYRGRFVRHITALHSRLDISRLKLTAALT
ncbi:hypothetical protein ES702_02405 [subsurface metagenome]